MIERYSAVWRSGNISASTQPKPDGALQFEASLGDWTREFSTSGIRGPMKLRANLFDPSTRNVLDTWETDLVLDDVQPENVSVEAPPSVRKGTARLQVSATATPPQSGIAEVGFIVGPKEDFAKPEVEKQLAKGKRKGADDSAWEGTLAFPRTRPVRLS